MIDIDSQPAKSCLSLSLGLMLLKHNGKQVIKSTAENKTSMECLLLLLLMKFLNVDKNLGRGLSLSVMVTHGLLITNNVGKYRSDIF